MKDLTLSEMQKEVAQGDTVLVDIWASWCAPCKRMLPILEDIDENTEGVTVIKVNADENPIGELGVSSLPTMILYKNGAEVKRTVGAMPKLKLLAFINE